MMNKHKKTRKHGRYYYMALTACMMLFVAVAGLVHIHEAQALRVSMKRIIFEGPKRSDIITVMNNTSQEQIYRLGWRRYRMDEKLSLMKIEEGEDDSDVKWADDMIRYAPRRVTVPPGGSQQIRILLRRPRDLAPGEYRSHLWIVTEQAAQEFVPESEKATKGESSFRLTMMPAITMPVFVRHGELEASAKITDVKLAKVDDTTNEVEFILHREGDRSIYGDLKIVCNAGGADYVAHAVRGIAVYTEVSKRYMSYDLNIPPEQQNACRSVSIEFTADQKDRQYSGQLMAKGSARM